MESKVELLQMLDITAPEFVQIEVSTEGVVWVNVDGICRLRACRCGTVQVNDYRGSDA